MVHATRIRLACCGVLTVLGVGCGDGGTGSAKATDDGDTQGDDAGANTDDDGGATKPESDAGKAPAARTFGEACEDACETHSACLGFSAGDCMSSCEAQAKELTSTCLDEATAEQECLSGLTCEQAKAYGTEGRRQHAICGGQARAYFAACAANGGETPEACSALCSRYDECDAFMGSAAACEEKCILQFTSYRSVNTGCGDAFLTFMGCGAQAQCAEVKLLSSSNTSPAACDDELAAMNQACN